MISETALRAFAADTIRPKPGYPEKTITLARLLLVYGYAHNPPCDSEVAYNLFTRRGPDETVRAILEATISHSHEWVISIRTFLKCQTQIALRGAALLIRDSLITRRATFGILSFANVLRPQPTFDTREAEFDEALLFDRQVLAFRYSNRFPLL